MIRIASLLLTIALGAVASQGAANPFLTACNTKAKTASQEGFFKDVFEQVETNDCQEAFDKLLEKKRIEIRDQRIENLEPLRDFPGKLHVGLNSTNLEDISAIATIKSVTSLDLTRTPSIDFTPLKALQDMDMLFLEQLHPEVVEDVLVMVRDHRSIKHVQFRNTQLNEGAQQSLTQMTWIDGLFLFGTTRLDSIDFLKPLTNIRWFVMAQVKVADISVVKHFKKMRIFQIAYTNVRDISPLTALAETLTNIDIEYSPIVDLSPLKVFANLDSLWLWGLHLTEIPELSNYKRLRHLNLKHNNIKDLSSYKDNYRVGRLNLQHNLIADLSPYKDLKGFKMIDLKDNPLGTTIEKTEANCPTDGTNKAIAGFCKRKTQNLANGFGSH